jgi:hypothetical protein
MTGSTQTEPAVSTVSLLEKALSQALSRPHAAPALPDPSSPAAANPAVARCAQAYTRALATTWNKSKDHYDSIKDGKNAYRQAMPPLSGHDNIRDFIACTAHGMLIDAIDGAEGARLLYAAQVAYATRETRSGSSKSWSTKS